MREREGRWELSRAQMKVARATPEMFSAETPKARIPATVSLKVRSKCLSAASARKEGRSAERL